MVNIIKKIIICRQSGIIILNCFYNFATFYRKLFKNLDVHLVYSEQIEGIYYKLTPLKHVAQFIENMHKAESFF